MTSPRNHLAGTCHDCGKSTKAYRCAVCRRHKAEQGRAYYRSRAQAGICVDCKGPATVGAFCLQHWFRNIGQAYGLGKKNGGIAMLRSLWEEQQGKCAVTGEKLVPGVNASLDHIQPLSRGGTSERSNLRWVTSTVNHMKWNLTDTEFVDKCRQIAQRADYAGKVSARMHIARSN